MAKRNQISEIGRKLYAAADVSDGGAHYVWAGNKHVLDFVDRGFVRKRTEEIVARLRLRLTEKGEALYNQVYRARFSNND
jgi:hypothetical protein